MGPTSQLRCGRAAVQKVDDARGFQKGQSLITEKVNLRGLFVRNPGWNPRRSFLLSFSVLPEHIRGKGGALHAMFAVRPEEGSASPYRRLEPGIGLDDRVDVDGTIGRDWTIKSSVDGDEDDANR